MKIEFFSTFNNSTNLLSLVGIASPAVIGVAGLAIAGGLAYLGTYKKNNRIKTELEKGVNSLREQITRIEKNRPLAEGFAGRAQNINKLLMESFIRYINMYNELEKTVFPEGDSSMSKASREAAQKKGELYFSPDEHEKIRALGRFSRYMKQIIETDF